jgi:hypothetical protein
MTTQILKPLERVPLISLRPDKLVFYTGQPNSYDGISTINENFRKLKTYTPARISHNFEISKNSRIKIKEKITWLFHYARKRNITSYSKKILINFKVGFYTFTLPSKQAHPTKHITKIAWNQFLTEIRKRAGMKNYVWKLEFQKNGNVHYHLVTDTYLDFFFIQKIWNRCINKLGYHDNYVSKFKNMSFSDFVAHYDLRDNAHADNIAQFNDMKINGPGVAPSVNCQAVRSSNNIGAYIAKYLGKSTGQTCGNPDHDDPTIDGFMRLWYCSQSLSKITAFVFPRDKWNDFFIDMCVGVQNVHAVFADYVTCLFFNLRNLISPYKNAIFEMLEQNRKISHYQPI